MNKRHFIKTLSASFVVCTPLIAMVAQGFIPQSIYSDPGLSRISNAVLNQGKIGFAAYSDPMANFPGYPDPGTEFHKLKWIHEGSGVMVELEAQSAVDADASLTTSAGQEDLVFLTCRKPTGNGYAFEGKFWIVDGDQLLAEETIFPYANFGISPSLNIGTDGFARMASFSAAGYAMIFHHNLNGNWTNFPATGFNQQHVSIKSMLDDADKLYIASSFSTGGQVDLKYYTADSNMGSLSGAILDQNIEFVCDLLFDPQGRVQILYSKQGNLNLATLDNGAWSIEILALGLTSADPVVNRADMAYQDNGGLLVGYQTNTTVALKRRPSPADAWVSLFSAPVASDHCRPTVLTLDDGSFQLVWSNNNEVFKLGNASSAGESMQWENKAVIYPNPSSGQFSLMSGQPAKGQVTIRVFDANGREVSRQQEIHAAGTIYLPDSLSPGLYFVSGTDSTGNRLFFEKISLTR